jgi:pimeloyl-ACP methyl ester carboxylesterase
VTVGWGERDKILGIHQAERVKTVIPSARVVTMPQCGHVPMSDDPDLVISLILQTTRSQAVPRSAQSATPESAAAM